MKILYIEHKTLSCFEEKSITEHVIIELFYAETLFDHLMCPLTIIELLQDFDDKP